MLLLLQVSLSHALSPCASLSRPSLSSRASPVMRYLDTSDSLPINKPSEDWSELDRWLQEGAMGMHEEMRVSTRPRLSVRTAGHVHEHFHHRRSDWSALGASPRLVENVGRLGFEQPSTTQSNAFEAIAKGENLLLADANGMGKTLAYVAPLVQRLWEWEDVEGRTPRGEVRTIIVVPTTDLAQQVLELARDVGKRSIRASIATGEAPWRTQKERMAGGLDLLVATMGRLAAHASPRDAKPSFDLSKTRLVVVDEASSLYAGSAPGWLAHKAAATHEHDGPGRRLPVRQGAPLEMWRGLSSRLSPDCAKVMVTSALPEGVEEEIRADLGSGGASLAVRIGRGLHTTRANVNIELIDCSVGADVPDGLNGAAKAGATAGALFDAKLEELREALAASASSHALVLCNTAAACDRIRHALQSDPFKCGPATCPMRDMPPEVVTCHESLKADKRRSALTAFRRPADQAGAGASESPARILVATGRAVRGLNLGAADASRELDHVVLFDYAPDAKSYLARVGCATRGLKPAAMVTALVNNRAQLSFAKALLAHDAKGVEHSLWGGGVVVDAAALKKA
jgi:hypothetical protein